MPCIIEAGAWKGAMAGAEVEPDTVRAEWQELIVDNGTRETKGQVVHPFPCGHFMMIA